MVSLVLFLNKLLRPPGVGGRESDDAYSRWENQWGRELARRYLEPAGDLHGKKILDVGCGLGGKTIAYGERGASEVIGADISEENVEASVVFASSENRPFRWAFFTSDASSLPLREESVDTVLANDAMEHFADPEGAITEIQRVVKRGGAVWFFFTPHFSPLGSHLYDYIYIPWCHLILRRKYLEGAIRHILQRRRPGAAPSEIDAEFTEIMRSYDEDLNHMSIRRFFRLMRQFPDLHITLKELEPVKFRFLKVLTYIPLVRELFTGTVICRLEREK